MTNRLIQLSPEEDALAARMAGYWTNFEERDPNGPVLPMWPLNTAADERIKVLDEPDGTLTGYQGHGVYSSTRSRTPVRRDARVHARGCAAPW